MIQGSFLLTIGLILIYMEFFLPGGIMGTAGALIIVSAIFFFAQEAGSLALALLFTLFAIVLVGLTIKLALWRIRSLGSKNTIYLDSDQEGFYAPKYDAEQVGKCGITETRMAPSGHIFIEGKKFQAVSQSGYLDRGEEVEVIGGRSAYLIVKAVKKQK